MAKTRDDLHEIFVNILGSRNVYFQPPENVKIQYPAIVYSLSEIRNTFADNSVYSRKKAYDVTVIDKNPDSEIVDKVSELPQLSIKCLNCRCAGSAGTINPKI